MFIPDSKIKLLLPACTLVAVMAGCASNIPELIRKGPAAEIGIPEVQLNPKSFTGSRVRWGGNIVSVENFKTYTLVEVLGRPLSEQGKPDVGSRSKGRFLAKLSGFLDPEEYPKGRLLSVTGTLSANIRKPIGKYLYDYPVIEAEARYLWPEEEPYYPPYPYYRDPFFHPWYPYGYRYPYWW